MTHFPPVLKDNKKRCQFVCFVITVKFGIKREYYSEITIGYIFGPGTDKAVNKWRTRTKFF